MKPICLGDQTWCTCYEHVHFLGWDYTMTPVWSDDMYLESLTSLPLFDDQSPWQSQPLGDRVDWRSFHAASVGATQLCWERCGPEFRDLQNSAEQIIDFEENHQEFPQNLWKIKRVYRKRRRNCCSTLPWDSAISTDWIGKVNTRWSMLMGFLVWHQKKVCVPERKTSFRLPGIRIPPTTSPARP